MTNTTDPAELIRQLAAEGHTARYIAKALDIRGIKPAKGGRCWHEKSVRKIAARLGVKFQWAGNPGARAASATTCSGKA